MLNNIFFHKKYAIKCDYSDFFLVTYNPKYYTMSFFKVKNKIDIVSYTNISKVILLRENFIIIFLRQEMSSFLFTSLSLKRKRKEGHNNQFFTCFQHPLVYVFLISMRITAITIFSDELALSCKEMYIPINVKQ